MQTIELYRKLHDFVPKSLYDESGKVFYAGQITHPSVADWLAIATDPTKMVLDSLEKCTVLA